MSTTGIDANAPTTDPQPQAPLVLDPPRSAMSSLFRVAKWEVIDLAVIIGLALASIAVGVAMFASFASSKNEAARLMAAAKQAGDVERNLGVFEGEIEARLLELEALQARVPEDLKPDRIYRTLQARANELGLQLQDTDNERWQTRAETRPIGRAEVSITHYDKSVEVTGAFKDVLALVATLEAWKELVAVRGVAIRAPEGGKRGPVHARLDLTIHQAVVPKGPAASGSEVDK